MCDQEPRDFISGSSDKRPNFSELSCLSASWGQKSPPCTVALLCIASEASSGGAGRGRLSLKDTNRTIFIQEYPKRTTVPRRISLCANRGRWLVRQVTSRTKRTACLFLPWEATDSSWQLHLLQTNPSTARGDTTVLWGPASPPVHVLQHPPHTHLQRALCKLLLENARQRLHIHTVRVHSTISHRVYNVRVV